MKRRWHNPKNVRLPIVNPSAVDAYLNRPDLVSFDFLKEVSKKELSKEASNLGMRFATDCWQHQLACWLIGSRLNEFLYYLKMGGGKSKIVLDLIRYRKRLGHLSTAIIVVPETLHVESWQEQIREHGSDLKYHLLVGERGEREALLKKKADLFVINFGGLGVFMSRIMKVERKINGKEKVFNELTIDKVLASEFASRFNFVAFDEIHRIVNTDSVYFDQFRWLSAGADFRYGLSGTSFGHDPLPLWSQFKLIDHGLTLGERIGMFRHSFYTPHANPWSYVKWEFDKKKVPILNKLIKNRSITYEVEEYNDMPRKMYVKVPIHLRGEGKAFYDRILEGLREARGDYRSMDNVFVRMRQCASGYISMKADDESRIEVAFKNNPKLDGLLQFIKSHPDEKILVFHEYTRSGEAIEEALKKNKIKFASCRGDTKDQAGEYRKFLDSKQIQIFVLNNQVGSEAINPQYVCRRAIFYESPSDPKRREQAEMRVWRPGQKLPVFIHDLLVLGTIEEKIIRYNLEGMSLLKEVMSGRATLETG